MQDPTAPLRRTAALARGPESKVTGGISRDEILRRFEDWLDNALAAEEPPLGVEAEILEAVVGESPTRPVPADAYSLWASVTALTQEVKLQGRSFKELHATLGSQAGRIAEEERSLLCETERRETERRCRKETLAVLIDLRDRLGRGLDSVRASDLEIAKPAPRAWLARLFGRGGGAGEDSAGHRAGTLSRDTAPDEDSADRRAGTLSRDTEPAEDSVAATLAALKRGYELAIEGLEQTLADSNAREIPCHGLPFDPRLMNAVDRQESSDVPEGTVLEVYRRGYEWNGELFRPAQVRVSCAPAGKENE